MLDFEGSRLCLQRGQSRGCIRSHLRRMLKKTVSKAAAVKDRRRYPPHFVVPFAFLMDLGERKTPASVSAI